MAVAKTFDTQIKFKFYWRSYQQKLLNELESHLEDRHIHIIAPPGSGKTVLGLELMLRINHPTLILVPTLAIQEQWVNRLTELFLRVTETPKWISTSIHQPALLTVTTYHAIHLAYSKSPTALLRQLKKQCIGTLIVDEAHHLKNEWWKTLIAVKRHLNPIVVGLTATPPYDVTVAEWKRYLELNGPVSAEIAVPDLVNAKDLCPHQDFIYFSLPSKPQNDAIAKSRTRAAVILETLKKDQTLLAAIQEHPMWKRPLDNLDWIYDNDEIYAAGLIFLHANGIRITDNHLYITGNTIDQIPRLDPITMEILLSYYLMHGTEQFPAQTDHQKQIQQQLKQAGVMERNRVSFTSNHSVEKLLTNNISKVESIEQIVQHEYNRLGRDLRMVILTDYIRKEYLGTTKDFNTPILHLGAVPIFEYLRKRMPAIRKIGVLSGSVIVVPVDCIPLLSGVSGQTLPYASDFAAVSITSNTIVHQITRLFEEGHIEVLIGTKSLLGEGWDAPSINSLILASVVGSFVSSNQMRGRAIRTQRNNPKKTSNIWHLVCVEPGSETGGEDLNTLERRFKGYVGIDYTNDPQISSGINRILPNYAFWDAKMVREVNQKTLEHAANAETLSERWNKGIGRGSYLIEEIKIPFGERKTYERTKTVLFNKTISYLLAELGIALVYFFIDIGNLIGRLGKLVINPENIVIVFNLLFAGFFLLFGKRLIVTARLYIKYRDIGKDMHKIGKALLNTLCEANIIHTPFEQLEVKASIRKGVVYMHLNGSSNYEQLIFSESLLEIVQPIEYPRYIIIRKSRLFFFVKQTDYHAVPMVLGGDKKLAALFAANWRAYVGKNDLVYTRNKDGIAILFKARMQSLSAKLQEAPERVHRWVS